MIKSLLQIRPLRRHVRSKKIPFSTSCEPCFLADRFRSNVTNSLPCISRTASAAKYLWPPSVTLEQLKFGAEILKHLNLKICASIKQYFQRRTGSGSWAIVWLMINPQNQSNGSKYSLKKTQTTACLTLRVIREASSPISLYKASTPWQSVERMAQSQ